MTTDHSSKKKVRILLADREGVFRLGLKNLFAVEDDLRVVAEADQAEHVVSLAKEFQPDVVFMQAEMTGPDPGSMFSAIKAAAEVSKIVVTASALEEEESLRLVKLGASGVILRSVDPGLFLKCVRKVAENEVWLPKKQVAQMARLLESSSAVRPRDTLTRREKTVISYLLQGWRNREIARHLGITEQTVKNHLRTIYDKLGVSDRLELVLYAIHQRLELPPTGPAASPRPSRASKVAEPAESHVEEPQQVR